MMQFRYPAALSVVLLAAGAGALAAQREPVLPQIAVPHSYYYREMYLPQLTSGPSAAAWSPDGADLVYSMQGYLWRQRVGTTEAAQLTDDDAYDYQPDWSSDGRWVVYASYRNDAIELWVVDLSTGAAHALLADGAVNVEPRFSPDGRRLAWVSTAFEGRWHVFVADFADGKLANVTRITPDVDSKLPRYYYSPWDHYLSPTWSPDGKELILVSNRGRIWGTGGFWRMEARPGAELHQIWYEETTWKARPDWSRDGKRVVYSSYLGRQWNQLFLMTSEGGDPFELTYGDFDNTAPRWSPDGTRIVYVTNEGGNTALRIIQVPGGAITPVEPTGLHWKRPRQTLDLTVTDSLGQGATARVSVMALGGRAYGPRDAWMSADDGFDRTERRYEFTYFDVVRQARVDLPPGRYVVEATKGYEYARQVDTLTVTDTPVRRTFALTRLANLPAQGWWSGDLHVHMNYGGTYRNTPAHLRLQAEAEDLHVVENLVVNKEARIPDIGYFSGRLDPVSVPGRTLIKHDEEYHTSYWGHTGQIGLTRYFMQPNYAGYVNTAAASLYPTNAAIADLTHDQGGLSGYVHPFESVPDPASSEPLTDEFPVDAALGKVDYIEVVGFSDHFSTATVWYRLLNTGIRMPTGAGTDAMANFASLRGPVGLGRVFVKSGSRLDYHEWLDALRAGHTFATNGPLLGLTLGNLDPGDSLHLPAATTLAATVWMRSVVAVDSLQIVSNGRVVKSIPVEGGGTRADARFSLPITESAWFTLRAFSRHSQHPTLDLYPFATTSPIYLTLGDRPIRSAADARYFIAWIDRLEQAASAHPGWNSPAERDRVLAQMRAAKARFEALAREDR